MRLAALFVAVLIMTIGGVAFVAPDRFVVLAEHFVTPAGLYAAAGLRVAIGLVLIRAARRSRTPKTLLVLGAIAILNGVITPLIGVDRSQAILVWWSAQGPLLTRLLASAIVAVGGWLAYAVSGG